MSQQKPEGLQVYDIAMNHSADYLRGHIRHCPFEPLTILGGSIAARMVRATKAENLRHSSANPAGTLAQQITTFTRNGGQLVLRTVLGVSATKMRAATEIANFCCSRNLEYDMGDRVNVELSLFYF
eukprot:SAG11_NODE_938_length_6471_cov_4.156780_5_plen_126_part_00